MHRPKQPLHNYAESLECLQCYRSFTRDGRGREAERAKTRTLRSALLPPPQNPQPASESEWVISIQEKLEEARRDDVASSWAKLYTYRVPRSLRDEDDDNKAYVPQVVSLGPYHHGK
ncbi:hypothetical protein H6P81_011970 [Aristolochia fimbriata]|uniref:Uncharacterized protein n=1 Tax=Aristolochia fimbriata TaxID=158543 RepID=A0AAV7EE81_ARIFI|nr:hypothetical protein H6P81_011970 [Aristolochia fimbriata]